MDRSIDEDGIPDVGQRDYDKKLGGVTPQSKAAFTSVQ